MPDERGDGAWAGSAGESDSVGDPERYRHLVEHIQDAVVEFEFVDDEPMVTAVNPAFVDVFGYEAHEIVGDSLNEWIVPAWLRDEARRLDRRTTVGEINYRRVRRETASGLREFLYRGVPFETEDGRRCGFAVYTDLTEDRRNESRIEVLHRLLRHNLRNKVGILNGSLDQLADRLDENGESHELAAVAMRSAQDLTKLAREAHEIHRTLDAPVPDGASVDAVDLVASVVDRFRETEPAAAIQLETMERAQVAATDRLEVAIAELVDNAIAHNPDPRPRVWVDLRPSPESGWIDVVVADDGPPIPSAERAVIAGEATITSIRHGSGLGLWLVRWTVERFGGTVAFDSSDAGGNEIRLRLPQRVADVD